MKEELIKCQEELQNVVNQLDAIITSAEDSGEPMDDETQKKFDKLSARMAVLETEIERHQKSIDIRNKKRSMQAAAPTKTPEQKVNQRYSLMRAVRLAAENKPLDGIELEMHQEAVKESKESGFDIRGIGIPKIISSRDITVGTATSAGDAVATNVSQIYPSLQPTLHLEKLGAKVMRGLVGNERLPIGNGLATSTWDAETDAVAETTPTIKKETLTPNRLASYIEISHQWLRQTSPDAERYLVGELSASEGRAVETAALNGAGSDDPLGIIGHADTNVVEMGTNGAVLTHAKLVEMQTAIAVDNADVDTMAYVITPELRGYLQTLKVDAGSGLFVWDKDKPFTLLGYNAAVSNLLPKTLTKGTGTGLHAVVFGDFSKLIFGEWGTREILVNPYIKDISGIVRITLNSFWDVVPVHGQSFATIKDAATA